MEKKILVALNSNDSILIDTLPSITNFSIDQVRRAIEWLKFKGLVAPSEEEDIILILDSRNEKDLPERMLLDLLVERGGSSIAIKDIIGSLKFSGQALNAAIQHAIKNKWIIKENGNLKAIGNFNEPSAQENLLKKISDNDKISVSNLNKDELEALEILKKRPNYIIEKKEKKVILHLTDKGRSIVKDLNSGTMNTTVKVTSELLTSGKWKFARFSHIDVSAQVRNYAFGRVHPLTDLLSEIREIFVSMGFSEIDGEVIQSCFWNFDVLFTPQDHPAREMHDTFYLDGNLRLNPPDQKVVENVSKFHMTEWKYDWKKEESDKLVLRTHTTPVTIQYLASHYSDELMIFSIGKVFRNEKMSYKHLMEFYQVEGIANAKGLNLRSLMGLQKTFYAKLGIKDVKFWPTYFPYTEPSLQSMIYVEKIGKWVELFGMGIFRPEVTHSIGISNNVLAWGGGLERIAMLRYELDDVREFYDNKLSWIRNEAVCR
jgi:phenylalanyl-tRNA synthetase alpha chain